MKTIHYLSLILLLLLAACQDEENTSCSVSIRLTAPEEYPELTFEGMKVMLTSKSGQATTYTATCSATGVADFQVEYGEYAAEVHHQTPAGVIFNGRVEAILLTPQKGGTTAPVELKLVRAQTNALVIKEIYYGGCKDKNGKSYIADQYVTLYNNSDAPLYLDGLCVAVVDFGFNGEDSPWINHKEGKRVPVKDHTWQFPGSGTDYPLAPGAATTIATNAVDHTSGEYGHANSINLSQVDWGFYHESFTMQVIAPGVTPMKLLLRTNPMGTKFQFGTVNLSLIVFRLPDDAEAYVANPNNLERRPQDEVGTKMYLMVPHEWVIDCASATQDVNEQVYQHVLPALDYKAAYMPDGPYRGNALIRKQTAPVGGRAMYQDTNNSATDMEVIAATLKHKP